MTTRDHVCSVISCSRPMRVPDCLTLFADIQTDSCVWGYTQCYDLLSCPLTLAAVRFSSAKRLKNGQLRLTAFNRHIFYRLAMPTIHMPIGFVRTTTCSWLGGVISADGWLSHKFSFSIGLIYIRRVQCRSCGASSGCCLLC